MKNNIPDHVKAYLEELEDLRRPAALRFIAPNGGIRVLHATVSGLQWEGEEAGFWADGTLHISLHSLLQVDGLEVRSVA